MAKLPIYTQQYGAQGRKADARDFDGSSDAVGRAMSGMGRALSDLGVQIKKNEDKKKMLDARKGLLEAKRDYVTTQKERRDQATNLDEFSEESLRYWDDIAAMSSEHYGLEGEAKQWFDEEVMKYGTSVYSTEGVYAAQQQGKILVEKATEIMNMEANQITDNPASYEQAYVDAESFVDLLPGAENAATRMQYMNMYREKMTYAKNDSILNSAETPEAVDRFVTAFKEEARNKQDLSPQQYSKFLKSAESKKKTLRNQQRVSLQYDHQDAVVRAEQTGQSDGRTLGYYQAVCDPTDTNCLQTQERNYQEYELAVETGQVFDRIHGMSTKEIVSMMDAQLADLSEQDKAAYLESKQYAAIERAVNAHVTALAKDPAKYVLEYNDTVKSAYDAYASGGSFEDYAAATMGEQARLGVSVYDIRLYSDSQIDDLVGAFDIANMSANELSEKLIQSQQDAGVYWPQVYREMAAKLPDEVLAIADMGHNPRAAKTMAEISGLDIKELESDATERQNITATVRDASQDAAKVYYQSVSEGPALYEKKVNAATKLALSYRNRGLSNPEQLAVDHVFGGFVYSDTFGIERSNQYAERVVRFAPDFLKYFGKNGATLPEPFVPPGMTKKNLINVIESRGTLINSPSSDNLFIRFTSSDGATEVLRNADGSPMQIPYDFIVNNTKRRTYRQRSHNRSRR